MGPRLVPPRPRELQRRQVGQRPAPRVGVRGVRDAHVGEGGLCIYEGTVSFVAFICLTYRDSPYSRELGRDNGRIPSSKQAAAAISAEALKAFLVTMVSMLLWPSRGPLCHYVPISI